MPGHAWRDLTPSRPDLSGRRLTWFPRSCHTVSGCEFRTAAGLGVPSGLRVNVSEPGRRKQAMGSTPDSAPENRRGIPVTLRGLWILAFRTTHGLPNRRTATHRHGYDPAHEWATISLISRACSTKGLNTDMSHPPFTSEPRPPRVGTTVAARAPTAPEPWRSGGRAEGRRTGTWSRHRHDCPSIRCRIVTGVDPSATRVGGRASRSDRDAAAAADPVDGTRAGRGP